MAAAAVNQTWDRRPEQFEPGPRAPAVPTRDRAADGGSRELRVVCVAALGGDAAGVGKVDHLPQKGHSPVVCGLVGTQCGHRLCGLG